MNNKLFSLIYRMRYTTKNKREKNLICALINAPIKIAGEIFPKNTILCYDSENKIAYFCLHFPKYQGDVKNVILHVTWYDCDLCEIGGTILKNCPVSIALFKAWNFANTPRSQKVDMNNDYEQMMQECILKKKHGTGGVRLSAKSDEYTTDSLRYKQVTEAAYWANLKNCRSGNASVVASSIR